MRRFTVWIAKKSGELLEVVPVLYEIKTESLFPSDGGYSMQITYSTNDNIAGYFVTARGMKTFQFVVKDLFEREAEYLGEL